MGANGAGSINMGGDSGGAGFNPATMMVGMALGGAVGQNIAGTMNGILSNANAGQNAIVPPVIPVTAYHVTVNGQATGPYNMDVLRQMATSGQLQTTTLVWKQGMANWEQAQNVAELAPLFPPGVPPIPANP